MLAPETILNEHYRITYIVEERPDCVLYRAIDQRASLRVLVAELPRLADGALEDVRQLAGQIGGVSAPGLLTLRDHFAQGATYYLVADDPGGQDLERVARDRGGPLPENEVLTIIDRLLVALDALHSRSPALLIGELRSTDLWSSLDGGLFLAPFALARHVGTEPMPYRAPELHEAGAEPTTSSDIYALGAVLYQLLTGWAPPTAPQRQAGTPLNSPRVLNARISALGEQLVLRALELRPANRYQRASEMRSALETVRLMAGRPLGATAPIVTEQLRTIAPSSGTPPPPPPPAVSPPSLADIPAGAASPPDPAHAAPTPTGGYGPPPAAPPPGMTLPQGYPQPAPAPYPPYGGPPAPAAKSGFRLSTGCLIALVAGLSILAVVVCLVGAWVLFLIFGSAGALTIPGATALATTGPAAAATAPAPTAGSASGPAVATTAVFTRTGELREDAVGAAAYSPDGAFVAVGVGNNIQLRRGEELEQGPTLSGHTGEISSLAFTPDGSVMASGAQNDPVIRLWDVAAGRELGTLEGHEGWIRSLAISPDGRLLASGSTDRSVRLWDVASRQQVAVLEGHTDFLGNVTFSPDGGTLASASRDGTVRLWDVQSRRQREGFSFTATLNPATNAPYWLTGLAYSPEGDLIAVGAASGSIYLIDPDNGQLRRELQGHENWVVIRGVAFSSDGDILASASIDGSVRLWSPRTGIERGVLNQLGLRLMGLSWHPDGQRILATTDTGGRLAVWNVGSQEIERNLQLAQGAVTTLAYSSDGDLLGTGGASGTVRLHQLSSGAATTLPGGAPTNQYIDFIGSSRLVAVSDAGDVVVIDLTQQGESRQLEGLNGFALNLAVSNDNRLIAAGNDSGEVTLWDSQTLEVIRTLRGLGDAVYGLTFSGDGSRLAAVTNRPTERPKIIVWNVQSGDQVATISGQTGPITNLALPAGEPILASASSDGSLKIYSAESGDELRSIAATPEDRWFSSFAFSPDGSLLVTGTLSGAVEFWNPRSGERLSRIELESGTVLSVAFRDDGSQIAASTANSVVFLLEPVG